MPSPQKSAIRGRSPRTTVPLRGLFLNGVWRCNCAERPPAVKLQTKNHGVNHGKWFYTCQKPPAKRCNFFLWHSDAEAREKSAVLANSRSEWGSAATTPVKPQNQSQTQTQSQTQNQSPRFMSGLPTPQSDMKMGLGSRFTPTAMPASAPAKTGKARMMTEDTDEFGWDDGSGTEEITKLLDGPGPGSRARQPDFGLAGGRVGMGDGASKAARTETFASPGKRRLSEMKGEKGDSFVSVTPTSVFSSRMGAGSQVHPPPSSMEFSMTPTPTPGRFRNVLGTEMSGESSEFALEVLKILDAHDVVVPTQARDELVGLLNKQDLKMKGISRGRDISRIALQKKDETIMRLNERIASLESQKEMDRATIARLRNR